MNKSEQIRNLYDEGMTVTAIARTVGVRYQFAYNVVKHHAAQKQVEVLRYVVAGRDDSDIVEDKPSSWWSSLFTAGSFMEKKTGSPTMSQM